MSFAATVDPKWVTAGPWRQFGNWYLQPQSFSPIMLNPYAWYDVHAGGSSSGITDSSRNARTAMTVGAGSNSPLWLPYSTPQLYLPGAAGNYVSTPDSVATSITGDITIACKLALANWTTTPTGALLGKWNAGGNSFILTVGSAAGDNYLSAFVDSGAGSLNHYVVSGITTGTWWIKWTYSAATGTSHFYKAADQQSIPSSWTEVTAGASVGPSGPLSPQDVAAPLSVGAVNDGAAFPFDGCIARVLLYATNGSTVVADFDPTLCTQTGYTDPYGNVWSINRAAAGRKSVVQSPASASTKSLFLLGTDDHLEIPIAAFPPMDVGDNASAVVVSRAWPTQGDFARVLSTEPIALQGLMIAEHSSFDPIIVQGRSANFAILYNFSQPVSGVRRVFTEIITGRSTTGLRGYSDNNTLGTVDNSAVGDGTVSLPGRIGSAAYGGANSDVEFSALLTFDRALSTGEIAQLVAYYGGGL